MKILHIASISNSPFNGVCVAVPQHVNNQDIIEEAALLNIRNSRIESVEKQIRFSKVLGLEEICEPFGRPDIIISHEAYRLPYLRISRQARELGIPYVIVPHGELSDRAQKKKRYKKAVMNLLLFNRYIEGAAAIQCLSKQELETTHFRCKKFIGTNGVILPSKVKMSFNRKSIDFLYIGRLEIQIKGIDLMLEAFSRVKELMRKTSSKLHIYGPDYKGRYDSIKNLIEEYGIEDFVILNHEILGEDKISRLLESDVFIQTSRTEGMPMGILEAMSYGIPCLITEGTSLVDDIEEYEAGWGCKTTVDAIAETIVKVFSNQDRFKRKSIGARKLVEDKYKWSIVAENTICIYKRFVTRSYSINRVRNLHDC